MGNQLLIGYGSFFIGLICSIAVLFIIFYLKKQMAIKINVEEATNLGSQIKIADDECTALNKVLDIKEKILYSQFKNGTFIFKPFAQGNIK